MERRLDMLATATQRSKSFYVCEALERCLADLEDAYLAETAYENSRRSGEKAIPLEEVMKEYGLES